MTKLTLNIIATLALGLAIVTNNVKAQTPPTPPTASAKDQMIEAHKALIDEQVAKDNAKIDADLKLKFAQIDAALATNATEAQKAAVEARKAGLKETAEKQKERRNARGEFDKAQIDYANTGTEKFVPFNSAPVIAHPAASRPTAAAPVTQDDRLVNAVLAMGKRLELLTDAVTQKPSAAPVVQQTGPDLATTQRLNDLDDKISRVAASSERNHREDHDLILQVKLNGERTQTYVQNVAGVTDSILAKKGHITKVEQKDWRLELKCSLAQSQGSPMPAGCPVKK